MGILDMSGSSSSALASMLKTRKCHGLRRHHSLHSVSTHFRIPRQRQLATCNAAVVPNSSGGPTLNVDKEKNSTQQLDDDGELRNNTNVADVLVSCPDQKGVIAALAQLFYGYGCNIISSDQHTTSHDDGNVPMFYQRITVDLSELHQGRDTSALETAIDATASRFNMNWQMHKRSEKKRVAILVSKVDHCLWDLLIRHANGELDCEIALVASNHLEPGRHIAEKFHVPFHHIPISPNDSNGDLGAAKEKQEKAMRRLLNDAKVDCVVLARYMQVMSEEFCEEWAGKCINIHHSFLPAFEGARPYHRAHTRGVKLIGATAHYVSSELDAGPIIVQEVAHVSHRDDVSDLKRKGRDLERYCLARALRLHVDNRLLLHGNK